MTGLAAAVDTMYPGVCSWIVSDTAHISEEVPVDRR
jgi:hypothetical protein